MKYSLRLGIALFILISGFASFAFAGPLQDEYKVLEQKRVELEQKRKNYETRLNSLIHKKKSITMVFYQCISKKDKAYWEENLTMAQKKLDNMENERATLVTLRKKLNKIRKKLENERVDIEARHTFKGPGSPYETEFRKYMKKLESEYFALLEKELFPGYNSYLTKLENYISFLKKTIKPCIRRG